MPHGIGGSVRHLRHASQRVVRRRVEGGELYRTVQMPICFLQVADLGQDAP